MSSCTPVRQPANEIHRPDPPSERSLLLRCKPAPLAIAHHAHAPSARASSNGQQILHPPQQTTDDRPHSIFSITSRPPLPPPKPISFHPTTSNPPSASSAARSIRLFHPPAHSSNRRRQYLLQIPTSERHPFDPSHHRAADAICLLISVQLLPTAVDEHRSVVVQSPTRAPSRSHEPATPLLQQISINRSIAHQIRPTNPSPAVGKHNPEYR
ncbi:hypothetical protein ACLOJK_034178 [Asimina triloba]